jgi:hypothetical protein
MIVIIKGVIPKAIDVSEMTNTLNILINFFISISFYQLPNGWRLRRLAGYADLGSSYL